VRSGTYTPAVEMGVPETVVNVEPETKAPGGGIETETFIGLPLDDPLLAAARANPALTIAVGTGSLVVMRLLAVAELRPDVALALLASSGIANVLVGSAVSVIPYAAPLAAIMLSDIARAYYHADRRALVTALGAILAGMLSLVLTPLVVLGVVVILLLVVRAFIRVRSARGRPYVRRQENLLAHSVGVGFPVLLLMVTGLTPWLPPEAIVSGGSTTVGYVTQSDNRWTHVLLYAPRVVRIYETSAITSRLSCEMPMDALSDTLVEVLGRMSLLPDCPIH
jgi:hypothetical protein